MYGSHMSLFYKGCKEKCISNRQKEQYLAKLSGADTEKMPGVKELTKSGPLMVLKSLNNQESCFNGCNENLARSQDPTKSARSTAQQLARGIFKVRRDGEMERRREVDDGETERWGEGEKAKKRDEEAYVYVWCCFLLL